MKHFLTVIFCCCISAASVFSQAFDPNCYYPVIGEDIDTVYGSRNEQNLGDGLVNMGPFQGESYGRIGAYGLRGHENQFTTFKSGPDFNLHKLEEVKEFGINLERGSYQFGHFRDRTHVDLIVFHGKDTIFWSDDEGKFDNKRFTTLRASFPNPFPPTYAELIYPYITYLTSDTVEDIIIIGYKNTNDFRDSHYVLLFKGGDKLYNAGPIAFEDSSIVLGYLDYQKYSFNGIYEDFRDVGRRDAILISRRNNLFYYKNDPPFSLSKFVNSFLYDTLLSRYENPPLDSSKWINPFVMQAFRRRNVTDSSVDLLINFPTNNDSNRGLWIYRGGPDFGKKRLTLNNPDFFMWEPYHYDKQFILGSPFGSLRDVGDMTGTGNRVLYVGTGPPIGFTSYDMFYVLGDAMDSKIDMFISNEYDCGVPDTLRADGDNLQDIIFGSPCSKIQRDIDRDWTNVGSISLLHGSKKIPVRLNSVFFETKLTPQTVSIYPNPCETKTVLTFDNCSTGKVTLDVYTPMGSLVIREVVPDVNGLQQYACDLSSLAAGAYYIRLVCHTGGWSATASVIKTGAAQSQTRRSLREMMGAK